MTFLDRAVGKGDVYVFVCVYVRGIRNSLGCVFNGSQ